MISRYIFDETMYRLCYSENFNVCYFRDPGRLSNRSGAAAISFDGCLVFHFRYSVVDSAMRARYSIAYRTLVRQVLSAHFSILNYLNTLPVSIPARFFSAQYTSILQIYLSSRKHISTSYCMDISLAVNTISNFLAQIGDGISNDF